MSESYETVARRITRNTESLSEYNEWLSKCLELQPVIKGIYEKAKLADGYVENSKKYMQEAYTDSTFPNGYFKGDVYSDLKSKSNVFLVLMESFLKEIQNDIDYYNSRIKAVERQLYSDKALLNELSSSY